MSTTPTNHIAGKRFYIAASYADKANRETLINRITTHGGAVVGHPLSADYYVAINYNKPSILGAEVVDVDTIFNSWVPDAVEANKTKMARQCGKTEMAQLSTMSVQDKLDRIIHLLTTPQQ